MALAREIAGFVIGALIIIPVLYLLWGWTFGWWKPNIGGGVATSYCTAFNSGPRPKGDGWTPGMHPSGKGCAWHHPQKVPIRY